MDWLTETWTSLIEGLRAQENLVGKGVEIFEKGGWAMWVLALISLFIFIVGFGVLFRLWAKGLGGLDEPTWRLWISDRDEREGPMGEVFDRVDDVVSNGKATVHDAFDEVRTREVEPFARDLKLMNTAVSAAPLVGLLGTVTGMLATFNALANGSGGDQTMAKIAEGISEALYTTETGLVVALPGLFFHYFLSRKFERFRALFAHVEAVWAQDVIEANLGRTEKRQRELVRQLTTIEIRKRVEARMKPATA